MAFIYLASRWSGGLSIAILIVSRLTYSYVINGIAADFRFHSFLSRREFVSAGKHRNEQKEEKDLPMVNIAGDSLRDKMIAELTM